jgi:hypothetical protein
MSAVAVAEAPSSAREALAEAIAHNNATCGKAVEDAAAALAAAQDGLAAAKGALQAVDDADHRHGQSLASAIKSALAKGRKAPLIPVGPGLDDRLKAERDIRAASLAVETLATELEQANAAKAAAEQALGHATSDVLNEELERRAAKALELLQAFDREQDVIRAIELAAFTPGAAPRRPDLVLAVRRVVAVDTGTFGSKLPGQRAEASERWRAFRKALQTDPTAEPPEAA